MRYVLTAVAALAVGGFFASMRSADMPQFYPGGPVQNSGMCQVYTGGEQYYGYLAPCPNQPVQTHKRSKK